MQPQVQLSRRVAANRPLVQFGQGGREVIARIGAGGEAEGEQDGRG